MEKARAAVHRKRSLPGCSQLRLHPRDTAPPTFSFVCLGCFVAAPAVPVARDRAARFGAVFRQLANDGQLASHAIDKIQEIQYPAYQCGTRCGSQASRSIRPSNCALRRMFAVCPAVAKVADLGSFAVRGMLWTSLAVAGPAGCPGSRKAGAQLRCLAAGETRGAVGHKM